jgi:hypothetical protein
MRMAAWYERYPTRRPHATRRLAGRAGRIGKGGSAEYSASASFDQGDHPPRHAHVYRNGKLIVKWDLENRTPMKGAASAKVLNLIHQLELEGRL